MLEGLKQPKKNFGCKVEIVARELSESDKKIFFSAIDAPKEEWPAKTLSNELTKRGIRLVDTTITKHRTKACWCYRDR